MSQSRVIAALALAAGAGIAIYAGTGLNAQRTLKSLKLAGVKNLKFRKSELQLDLVVLNHSKTETTLNNIEADCFLDGELIGTIKYQGKIKLARRSESNPNGLTTIKNIRARLSNGLSIVSSLLDFFASSDEKKMLRITGTMGAEGMNYPFSQEIPFSLNPQTRKKAPEQDPGETSSYQRDSGKRAGVVRELKLARRLHKKIPKYSTKEFFRIVKDMDLSKKEADRFNELMFVRTKGWDEDEVKFMQAMMANTGLALYELESKKVSGIGSVKLSLSEARQIAMEWHGGQLSALYQFGSSGVIQPWSIAQYMSEIDENIRIADTKWKKKLKQLRAFINDNSQLLMF